MCSVSAWLLAKCATHSPHTQRMPKASPSSSCSRCCCCSCALPTCWQCRGLHQLLFSGPISPFSGLLATVHGRVMRSVNCLQTTLMSILLLATHAEEGEQRALKALPAERCCLVRRQKRWAMQGTSAQPQAAGRRPQPLPPAPAQRRRGAAGSRPPQQARRCCWLLPQLR